MRKIIYLSSILVAVMILSGCSSIKNTSAPTKEAETTAPSTTIDYKKIVPGISDGTIQKFESGEKVVVIVGVSLPDATKKYNPETDAPIAAKVMDEVIAGLNPDCYSNQKYYQVIPYFAVQVTKECLEALSKNKQVIAINENKASSAF